jgi:alkylated DNA repair dioxygenase AlkB
VLPEGFVLQEEFLTEEEESGLIALFRGLSYGSLRMHGVTAKRRVAQFGWHYSFESFRLTPAPAPPAELDDPRRRAAALASVDPEEFAEALITEYGPGSGIGWHRDAPPFGIVAGISLGAACRMRFQRGKGAERVTTAVVLPPRSIYLLTGPSRAQWQHMIPPVGETRWSITFRTLR